MPALYGGRSGLAAVCARDYFAAAGTSSPRALQLQVSLSLAFKLSAGSRSLVAFEGDAIHLHARARDLRVGGPVRAGDSATRKRTPVPAIRPNAGDEEIIWSGGRYWCCC